MVYKCIVYKCKKIANYNYEEDRPTRLYCGVHRKPNMVNIGRYKCNDCSKIASFNFKGQTIRLYCITHKKPGMINLTKRTCLKCDKHANYNYLGEKKRLYCVTHKKMQMVNLAISNKKQKTKS